MLISVGYISAAVENGSGSTNSVTVIAWDTNALAGWPQTASGGFASLADGSTLRSVSALPREFALHFSFRVPKGVNGQMPGWINFEEGSGKISHAFSLDVYYGMQLHLTGKGVIAGVLPGPDPGSVKPEVWYDVRVQSLAGRLCSKFWPVDKPEPRYWQIDVREPEATARTSRLDFVGNKGVEVSSIQLEKPSPLPAYPVADLRGVRFKRVNRPQTDFRVAERPEAIEVRGDVARMIFSRKGCAVSTAYIRGELFPVGHLPDLRYVTADGTEYRQSYSDNGTLRATGYEGNYYVLEGECRPADTAGTPGPASFQYQYRIHNELGMVLVSVRCKEWQTPVRRFEFVNSLADRPEQEIDYFHCSGMAFHGGPLHAGPYSEPEFWDRWGQGRCSVNRGPVTRDDKVLIGEELAFGRWSSGKYAFEVQGVSYFGSLFSAFAAETKTEKIKSVQGEGEVAVTPKGKGMLDDLRSEKFMVARTQDGKRCLDMVFINLTAKDAPANIGVATYRFGFQFLPFRKYRPVNVWLNGNPVFTATTDIDSISLRQGAAREMTRMGLQLTHLGAGNIPMSVYADMPADQKPLSWQRARRCIESLHSMGLRGAPGWWFVLPPGGFEDMLKVGWLTEADAASAATVNYRAWPDSNGGRYFPRAFSGDFCMADPKSREVRLQKTVIGSINQYHSDGVYLDGFIPFVACENRLHGCMGRSFAVEGFIEFLERFRTFSRNASQPLDPLLWGHGGESSYGPQALADLDLPGEMFVPPWVPNRAEQDTYFTSLLHGRQVIYCSEVGNGGPDWENVRTYEGAISRCALVQAASPIVNAWIEGKHDYIGLKLWHRCMMPLGVYEVRTSEVHHPFDEDYGNYAQVSEKEALALVYHRPGDVLLVVVRDVEKNPRQASVSLHASALGLADRAVWCYDPSTGDCQRRKVQDDWVDMGQIDLTQGPSLFHVVRAGDQPQVVWHDPVVWNVDETRRDNGLALRARGVPESEGIVYVACGESGRPKISHGTLFTWDDKGSIAKVQMVFNAQAETDCSLNW